MIPVYNELDHLETFLAQVDRASFGIPKKMVFVDDCSSDGSRELLERYPFKSETGRIRHDTNHGNGAALQAGIAAASGLPARNVHAPGMARQTLIGRDSVA